MSQLTVDAGTLSLSGAVSKETVEGIRDELRSALKGRRKHWLLDLTGVQSMDSAGVQLITAFLHTAPEGKLGEISEPVRCLWEKIGAVEHFAERQS